MSKNLQFTPIKATFLLLSGKIMGVSLSPQHPLCPRACMDSMKTNIFKNLNSSDIQNA